MGPNHGILNGAHYICFEKMQLISAIYCLALVQSLLDQPLAADFSLVMFIFAIPSLRVIVVMLD